METYIVRLMACGYTREKAEEICKDFMLNLHLFDLEFFVDAMEQIYVG